MRGFFVLLLILLCVSGFAQTANDTIYYRYIIAEPQGALFSEKCKLRIDDGIKPRREKGKRGEDIYFKSYAAALMYLTSQGWELVSNYNTTTGSVAGGYGSSSTQTYWILRRPSTKEEVDKIVNESLQKDNE